MLDTNGSVATWAGLTFNPKKCATLHIDGKRRQTLPTQFHIQEGVPPALSEIKVYEHLGAPTGYHVTQSDNKALKDINFKLKMIGDSLLDPWQKLDAINTIHEITSATNPPNHILRNGDFTRFADWRFIHRARLDCVPLNGSQRFGNKNRKCR